MDGSAGSSGGSSRGNNNNTAFDKYTQIRRQLKNSQANKTDKTDS